jgi:hypothetical protein
MTAGAAAARQVVAIISGKTTPQRARSAHVALLEQSTKTLFRIIRQYYDHSFRELILNRTGPLQIHRAVIGALAGNVFPPPWPMRWRIAVFNACVWINRYVPLVPRRPDFSLLDPTKSESNAEIASIAAPQ